MLENAGKKADINAILSELEDYRWQTIFLCPEEDKNKIEGSNHNYLLREEDMRIAQGKRG